MTIQTYSSSKYDLFFFFWEYMIAPLWYRIGYIWFILVLTLICIADIVDMSLSCITAKQIIETLERLLSIPQSVTIGNNALCSLVLRSILVVWM